jgi:hypothetical protein
MRRLPIALCAVLLAACSAPADDPSASEKAADSAAVEAISHPAAVETVNRRLDQARKDADARSAEGMEQVRQAEEAEKP